MKVTKKIRNRNNYLTSDDYMIEQDIFTLNKALNNEELTVEYISGYDKNNIPHAIKHGIMLHIAEMYDRQATIVLVYLRKSRICTYLIEI